jgi:hypothetical protein
MSSEIKRSLEHYITKGENLLEELKLAKLQQKNVQANLGRNILAEGVRYFTADIFESAGVGRTAKKLTKAYLEQQKKAQQALINRNYNIHFDSWMGNIKEFLSTISFWKTNLKEKNSQQLINRFDKVQEYVRPETKISRSIRTLRGISNKPLIYNKEIVKRSKKVEAKQILLPPGSPYTGFRKIEDLLKKTTGHIKIIDPYVNEETLDILLSVPKNLPLFLLTTFTGGENKERRFVKLCKKFKAERSRFEIRKTDPKHIHDRFILTKGKGWSIGTSLNSIGNKMSIITELLKNPRKEAEDIFEDLWTNSQKLI